MTEKELKNFLSSAEEAGNSAMTYLKSDNQEAYSLGLRRMEKFLSTLKEDSSVLCLQNLKEVMKSRQLSNQSISSLIADAQVELNQLKIGKAKTDELKSIPEILDVISRAKALAEMSENLEKIKLFISSLFPGFAFNFKDNELIKLAIDAGLIAPID